jgi:hypothetical protein
MGEQYAVTGEVTRDTGWDRDVEALEAALLDPSVYLYEARLPTVIGFVPDSERYTFSHITPAQTPDLNNFVRFTRLPVELMALRLALPSTFALIEEDVGRITQGHGVLAEYEIRRHRLTRNTMPTSFGLHLEQGVSVEKPEVVMLPIYTISSNDPALFYAGPAGLHKPDGNNLRLHDGSLDFMLPLVPATEYAIVRMSYATIHRSPYFIKKATRTFIRIFAGYAAHA